MRDRRPLSDRGERLTVVSPTRQKRADSRRVFWIYSELATAVFDLAMIGVFSWLALSAPKVDAGPLLPVVIPLGVTTGYLCRRALGVPLVVAAVVPLEVTQGYANPFVLVMAGGSWLVGALVRDHRLLATQLRARSRELGEEREVFAAKSVRYERARIARELHDMVGHSLSVVVLQAAAGERLVDRSPEAAAQALDDIGQVARQAQEEIGALVTLLTPENDDRTSLPDITRRLVAAAAATGLDVTCRIDGPTTVPAGATSHAAYRVIQEGVTNALRHAAGAPIRISVREDAGYLDVEIWNGPPSTIHPVPADLAGGYGLAGMRDRVAGCQGDLNAGPLPGGGWRVHARLPLP